MPHFTVQGEKPPPQAALEDASPVFPRLRELHPRLSFPREMLYSFLIALHADGHTAATGAINLVRTLLPEVWDTGAETKLWAPREPGGSSGDLQERCNASTCSLFRFQSQTG